MKTILKINRNIHYAIISYLILNLIWSAICVHKLDFFQKDGGFKLGLGYLTIFSICIFISQGFKKINRFIFSTLLIYGTFLLATFAAFFLSMNIGYKIDSSDLLLQALYIGLSSLTASVLLTLIIHRYYGLENLRQTILYVFIMAVLGSIIWQSLSLEKEYVLIGMYLIWQTLVLIPILHGLNKKPVPNNA